MRTSTLVRSISAVVGATLALGTLAVTPAGAATPNGITREAALTVIQGYRTGPLPAWGPGQPPEVLWAAHDMFERSCKLAPGETIDYFEAEPVTTVRSADGMLAYAFLVDADGEDTRTCLIGVTASTASNSTLTGSSTVSVDVYRGSDSVVTPLTSTSTQKGDVFVTEAISVPSSDEISRAMFSSAGNFVDDRNLRVKTFTSRTWGERNAAKKAYDKRLKASKKAYAKAMKKAGANKSKKAKAKTTYKRKRAKARATYRAALRPAAKLVPQPSTPRPYSLSTPWIS